MSRRRPIVLGMALLLAQASQGTAQTLEFTPVGSIAGPVDMIKVSGRYAYVSAAKTLSIVDIADPAAPKRVGSYTFPELIWGFAVDKTTVYVAGDTYGFAILDASNAAAPVLRGAIKTPGQAKNVAMSGTKALVADHVAGIDLIDLSTPAKPALAGSFFVDGFAKDVVTTATVAFALDQPGTLYAFDLTKPGSFEPASMVKLANPIPLRAQLAVSSESSPSGPRAAVVVGGGPLQIYDVSNPRAMVPAGTYRTPGNAQRIALIGTRAYVADGPAGLLVLDLSIPSQPRVAGSYKTMAPARDVAVAGSLVFVNAGSEQVVILQQGP